MNPAEGNLSNLWSKQGKQLYLCCSGETTNANDQLPLQIGAAVRLPRVQHRRTSSLLPILHHPADNECTLPEHPLYGLRIRSKGTTTPVHLNIFNFSCFLDNKQGGHVQPHRPHAERRTGRRHRLGHHHTPGRVQDAAEHATDGQPHGPGAGGQDRLQVGRSGRLLQGHAGACHVSNAGDRDLLVHL